MTLTEIEELWAKVEELLEQNGGEETEEVTALLDQFDLAQRDKVDGYCAVIDKLRDDEMAALARCEEYQRKADAAARNRQWLRQRLAWHMERMGIREIKGQLRKVKWVPNGGAAPVELLVQKEALPVALLKKGPVEANLTVIRKALEDENHPYHQLAVAYARIGERGEYLRVY